MTPEEQLQIVDAVAETLKDSSPDVRKEAFHCLVGLGLDGLARIVDVIDEPSTSMECRHQAVLALGMAFSEGKVDKSGMIKVAIKVLEDCLSKDSEPLIESAIEALGEIGPQAISSKDKLLALLATKKVNNRICVRIGTALLKISPVN